MKIVGIALMMLNFQFLASAEPVCNATVTLRDNGGTAISRTLQIQDPTVDPVLMLGQISGVSFAAWYHTKSKTYDISITATSIAGTYGRGLGVGPQGLTIDYDQSPNFEAILKCNN